MRRARFEEMAAEGVKYLEENREREGVNSTESGLQFRVIKFHSKPFVTNCFHGLGRAIIRSDGSARRTNALSRGVSYG